MGCDYARRELITFRDGEPIGSQGVGADDFHLTHEVFTGSWLGRARQGRRLGTDALRSALGIDRLT